MKKKPEEPDTLDSDVGALVYKLDYLSEAERTPYVSAIADKIRSEPYLRSLCAHNPDYLHCAVSALASFGTDHQAASQVVLGSRTQVIVAPD